MPLSITQDFDGVTPPTLPAGWTFDSKFVTSVSQNFSAPNGLTLSGATASTNYYGVYNTPDTLSTTWTASCYVWLNANLARAGVLFGASSTTFSTASMYYAEVIYSTTGSANRVRFYKSVAGVETSLASVIAGATFTPGRWYLISVSGSYAAPTTSVSISLMDTSNSQYMDTSGNFSTGFKNCLIATDGSSISPNFYGLTANSPTTGGDVFIDGHNFTSGSTTVPPLTNLFFWLKADAGTWKDTAGTTLASSDGDLIARWDDQSGNGNNVTQATSGNRPVLKTGIYNGKPTLRLLNGNHTQLDTGSSITHGIASGDFWFVAVFQPTIPVPGFNTVFSIGNFAPAFYTPRDGSGTHPSMYLGGHHLFSSVEASSTLYLTEFGRVSGTLKLWQGSGGAVPTLDATTFSLATSIASGILYVGNDNSNDWFNGDIAEVLLYNASLNSTDQTALENYLLAKYWGVGINGFFLRAPMNGLGCGGPHFADPLGG